MASSSSLLNPLTSLIYSTTKSELCFFEPNQSRFSSSSTASPRLFKKCASATKVSYHRQRPAVVCKAVSVKPQIEIEGLNIAEDVTQVKFWCLISFWACLVAEKILKKNKWNELNFEDTLVFWSNNFVGLWLFWWFKWVFNW